jgi:regulatory protein
VSGIRKSSPRKLSTEDALYTAAMRALMRRAYSIHDMRVALERRAETESLVRPVLDRLKERKLLDDGRYAREFARARASQRAQGRYRIARELRARGVPDRHIEAAFAEVFSETDEAALLAKRLERKLKAAGGPLNARKRASVTHSLMRSGFSADMIRRAMRGLPSAADGAADESAGIELPEEE